MEDMTISASAPLGRLADHSNEVDADFGSSVERDYFHVNSWEGYPETRIALYLLRAAYSFDGSETYYAASSGFLPTLHIFESAVVSVLKDVYDYAATRDLATEDSDTEIKLLDSIAGIREELAMIDDFLLQQERVAAEFDTQVRDYLAKRLEAHLIEKIRVDEWENSVLVSLIKAKIKTYRDRVAKIDRDAKRVDKIVQDRLNVKRTFASIRDSRASMNDAKTSLLLTIAVIGFTVITVLFAPLAFMTALFALNIDELQRHKKGQGDDAYYPSWYIVVAFCKLKGLLDLFDET